MENPIYETNQSSLITKVKNSFFNHYGFELFDVKPQMPKQQISHFAKKAIQLKQPVAIQINDEEDIITEIMGYPSISENSNHLILHSYDKKVVHLITGSTIRHIRKI